MQKHFGYIQLTFRDQIYYSTPTGNKVIQIVHVNSKYKIETSQNIQRKQNQNTKHKNKYKIYGGNCIQSVKLTF